MDNKMNENSIKNRINKIKADDMAEAVAVPDPGILGVEDDAKKAETAIKKAEETAAVKKAEDTKKALEAEAYAVETPAGFSADLDDEPDYDEEAEKDFIQKWKERPKKEKKQKLKAPKVHIQESEENIIRRLKLRKKGVKRFAAVFFIALILLTFFSNTIMNSSLPEVSTITVGSTTVSSKVRCQGPVEVSKDVEVMVSGTRTVKEVYFEDGDTVHEGDVIMTFDETKNTELEEAEDALTSAERDYEKDLLDDDTHDYDTLQDAIDDAADALSDARDALTQAYTDASNLTTAKAEKEALQSSYDTKNAEVAGLQAQVDSYTALAEKATLTDAMQQEFDSLNSQLGTAKSELSTIESNLSAKSDEVTTLEGKTTVADAQDTVDDKQDDYDDAVSALSKQKKTDSIQDAKDAIDDLTTSENLDKKRETVEELKAADDTKEVKATGDGIISGLTVKAGDKVDKDTVLATIQLSSSGYEVSCTVPKKDASRLRVNDVADIENIWGDDVEATVRSIKANPDKPNQESIVKFTVKGDVQQGETLQFAVGGRASRYDLTVPNSAVKEDIDGNFVLVVTSKATPFGNRYIVKKVKVEILAQDTKYTAVQAELEYGMNVVTNASKPLEDGKQVRLIDD